MILKINYVSEISTEYINIKDKTKEEIKTTIEIYKLLYNDRILVMDLHDYLSAIGYDFEVIDQWYDLEMNI